MSELVIGIDPGFSGAIAIYQPSTRWLQVTDMPTAPNAKGKTELNCAALLEALTVSVNGAPQEAWVEKVGVMPGQGISSGFRFGQQVGAIEMAVTANKHQLRYVTPAVWKAYFGLSKDKGVARGYAIKRFPNYADLFSRVKDDGRAEAALIALFGAEHSK